MNDTIDCIDCKELSLREASSKIKDLVSRGRRVELVNPSDLHGLASGLKSGEITVRGRASDFLGMFNQGAKIIVEGDAGAYVGDNSHDGEIWVKGDVGEGLGVYAYGGTFVVSGNAGNAAGEALKGGFLAIDGDVGDDVGRYMVGGRIVICGNAGKNLGHMMIRGEIFLCGEAESLGSNSKYTDPTEGDLDFLRELLGKYGMEAEVEKFKKVVPISPCCSNKWYQWLR